MRDVLVLLPLYRNPDLVPDLFRSLISAQDDFRAIGARLLVIVDSPDDHSLLDMLKDKLPALEAAVPTELHVNKVNLGFVGSVNFGFARAIEEKRDAIILNSDVVVTPGAFREIRDVAYLDHMTGFVSPRSNNATICSLPDAREFRHRSFDESYATYRQLSRLLPRVRYVPTTVGFCMYIKWTILAEFGCFDPVYGGGYNEENDLVMRANRCGYRAVLANHAFVYHIGEQSFSLTSAPTSARELENGKILRRRYPEYERSINRAFDSPETMVETMLVGLLPDSAGKLTIAFDWSNIGSFHNGTFEAAKAIVVSAAKLWRDTYNIVVIATDKVAAFHGIDRLAGLTIVERDDAGVYAAVIRIGQPFQTGVIDDLIQLSPVVVLYMLDTIALDCQNLDELGLKDVWQHALDATDVVVYISDYTRDQFRHRFRIPAETVEVSSLLSLDTNDYRFGAIGDQMGTTILVVGNHFSHKFIDPTVAALVEKQPDAKIVVLGGSTVRSRRVEVHPSGSLDQDVVDQLYRDARVIVFPSHYEGFGLPILHALARHRPVIARSMPLYDEIAKRLGGSANLYQRDTVADMVDLACDPATRWTDDRSFDANGEGWDRVVGDLEAGMMTAVQRTSFDRLVIRYEQWNRTQRLTSDGLFSSGSPRAPITRIFGIPVTRLLGMVKIMVAVALLATMAVLACSAFVMFRGYSALPIGDAVPYGTRATILKILSSIDGRFGGGRNILLDAGLYVIQACHAWVLVMMASRAGITGGVRTLLIIAITLCALLGAHIYENLTSGVQADGAIVAALASASFLSFAIFTGTRRRLWLWVSIAVALLGSLEMAHGLVIFPILTVWALYIDRSRKLIMSFAAASVAIGLTYIVAPGHSGLDLTAASFNPLRVAEYATLYLGSFPSHIVAGGIVGQALGTTSREATIGLAAMFGLMLIATFVGVTWFGLRRKRFNILPIVGVFLVATAGALLDAIIHSQSGIERALGSSSAIGSSLATLAVAFLALWIVSTEGRLRVQAAAIVAATVGLVLVALSQTQFIQSADIIRIARDLATTAMYARVDDAVALRYAAVNSERIQANDLRARSASIFADERFKVLGRRFTGPIAECAVPVMSVAAIPSGGARVSGSAAIAPLLPRPPLLFILNSEQRIVGFAFASLMIEQAGHAGFDAHQSIPWIGHVQPGATGPYVAVLPSKSSDCNQVAAN